jgi:hypothetical protein
MLNPFTREQDAFKMLVAVMAGAALVIAVTLITGSSVAGIVLAISLVLIAAGKLWRDYQRLDDADSTD